MALSFYLSVQGCLGLFSLFISAKFQEKWYEELNQMYIAQKIQRKKRQQKNIKKNNPKSNSSANYQIWFKYFCSSGKEKNRFNSEPRVINIHCAFFPIWK